MSGDHNHVPRDFGPAFAWAIGLNAAYVVVEAGFGFVGGSLALVADAAHNLTDVGGLVLAWGAVALSRRTPSARHTYGLGRTSILAALVAFALHLPDGVCRPVGLVGFLTHDLLRFFGFRPSTSLVLMGT